MSQKKMNGSSPRPRKKRSRSRAALLVVVLAGSVGIVATGLSVSRTWEQLDDCLEPLPADPGQARQRELRRLAEELERLDERLLGLLDEEESIRRQLALNRDEEFRQNARAALERVTDLETATVADAGREYPHGRVRFAAGETLVVGAGSKDGVERGLRFSIFHGDMLVGKAVVENAQESACQCRVVFTKRGHSIQEGDFAASRLE